MATLVILTVSALLVALAQLGRRARALARRTARLRVETESLAVEVRVLRSDVEGFLGR
jgi:hypothetical protein